MGAIKNVVDLINQLANSVKDRKVTLELNKIQSLTLDLQSEQAHLHEANVKLREERIKLIEKIHSLEAEIRELNDSAIKGPIAPDFVLIENATHECSRCGYKLKVES
jgi:cob(I)alamin adenosyltransferase